MFDKGLVRPAFEARFQQFTGTEGAADDLEQ